MTEPVGAPLPPLDPPDVRESLDRAIGQAIRDVAPGRIVDKVLAALSARGLAITLVRAATDCSCCCCPHRVREQSGG